MRTVLALSGVVIKELYRRKDFYVLFVLTALVTIALYSARFFNDPNIARYVKDVTLHLIWISTLVIAVTTTARQIPAERESRTIFPLLAKPVSRGQVILGKFAGCWFACGIALVVFYLFFTLVSGNKGSHWAALSVEGLWLTWVMAGIVVSMALLGSIVFAAPSSNATIIFVIVGGILLLGRHLGKVSGNLPEPLGTVVYGLYYIIPHLEWYNIIDLVVNNHKPVALVDCMLATIYGATYSAFVLSAAWLLFRRKALST